MHKSPHQILLRLKIKEDLSKKFSTLLSSTAIFYLVISDTQVSSVFFLFSVEKHLSLRTKEMTSYTRLTTETQEMKIRIKNFRSLPTATQNMERARVHPRARRAMPALFWLRDGMKIWKARDGRLLRNLLLHPQREELTVLKNTNQQVKI